jgi:hypothetical protein
MTKRKLAEMMLTGRRAARRISATFVPDRGRLIMMGLTHEDIDNVEWTVKEIERVTEQQLADLQ